MSLPVLSETSINAAACDQPTKELMRQVLRKTKAIAALTPVATDGSDAAGMAAAINSIIAASKL